MIKKILASSVLVPMLSLGFYATPALASWWQNNSDDITVTNVKNAVVLNDVTVVATTGDNSADGGNGGSGGNGGVGGNVNINNDNNDGGNGGSGSNGGSVTTGNAYAKGKVYNKVNTDITKIDCDCVDTGDITVNNTDSALVGNALLVAADTGTNYVDGGAGGSGGEGGVGGHFNLNNDNNNGGTGGSGDNGGTVNTGNAYAKGKVFNKVNTIVTRVQ
ncbi:hypothetical protein A2Z53_03260 [Candidatus Giovannonibacteria bacterium RIFCSPHIGHO2_02_42_15]|uniref:PE-PGRS family protein n=2 Tax=Candidatus Giovannoniibacteriota TaxID=1752738 RepID=A0A1F5VPK9_9BACT|nr:MAG: hypothetical protein UV11_C0031G0003 [Candidatus Giovannonibacteria bacterium GW2011_GWF2_42_19]OGF65268.1 MAG: hypothetical protein A2Z53_03260 [Candidatus Giovannonibacteria bacterium RIFCSPHIGHO2_02_42_15]